MPNYVHPLDKAGFGKNEGQPSTQRAQGPPGQVTNAQPACAIGGTSNKINGLGMPETPPLADMGSCARR